MKEKTTVTKISLIPEWAEAEKRDVELRGKLAAVERKIAGLHGEFAELSKGLRTDDVESKAQALLNNQSAASSAPSLWTVGSQEELGRAQQERIVLTRAIELHTQKMNTLRAVLSRQACEELLPTYRARVLELKALVQKLGEMNDTLHATHMELEANGFSSSALTNMEFHAAGRASDSYSRVSLFEKECQAQGF
jgi:hypothetical protein